MLDCTCGYIGVNLKPNYDDNTARCPGCETIFQGIPAEDALYDDFSSVKVGDTLKRVWMFGMTPTTRKATVTEVTETEITCRFVVDTVCIGKYDRVTGVSKLGTDFGFITFNID